MEAATWQRSTSLILLAVCAVTAWDCTSQEAAQTGRCSAASESAMLQVTARSSAVRSEAQDALLAHLAGTPFVPGVMHNALRKHAALAGLVEIDGVEPSNKGGLAHPDFATMNITMPWEAGLQPLVSCGNKSQQAKDASDADMHLQQAISIFCKAGLGSMVEFYVDPRFEGNHARLRGADGWIPKAYLTYMGLSKQRDNTSGEEDMLVQSVHHFSKYPIVLTNFGTRVPRHMTPDRFPNLVLMHARTSATAIHKGFNLNKFVSMLFSKVRGGVVLDADQWVSHGVDVMVERAFEETTAAYPYPVMPVHWMSRDPDSDDMKDYPLSYTFKFKNPDAPNRTMRWGHSHPTWTHYALPWLAKWTSYVLAPEATGSPQWLKDQGFVSDEPLMNFALWADGLTKQWCKFDIPSVEDYGTYLHQSKQRGIHADSKYYPRGIAYMFFTAHAAKDADKSYTWLSKLWDDGDDKRQAVLYDGMWFGSGRALQAYDPKLKCIA